MGLSPPEYRSAGAPPRYGGPLTVLPAPVGDPCRWRLQRVTAATRWRSRSHRVPSTWRWCGVSSRRWSPARPACRRATARGPAGRRLRGGHQCHRRPCAAPDRAPDQDLLHPESGAGGDPGPRSGRRIRSGPGPGPSRPRRPSPAGHREGHGAVADADHVRRSRHLHLAPRDRGTPRGPYVVPLAGGRNPGMPRRR